MVAETDEILDQLEMLDDYVESIRRRTLEILGPEMALRITRVHQQNWINLAVEWIPEQYPQRFTGEKEDSDIVFDRYLELYSETRFLQRALLRGYYEQVFRELRYALETISQGYYVQYKHPELTYHEQLEKAIEYEVEKEVPYQNYVRCALRWTLDFDDDEIDGWLKPLYSRLSRHVHPSPDRLNRQPTSESQTRFNFSFNGSLARKALDTTDEVFDAVTAFIIDIYPETAHRVRESVHFPTEADDFPFTSYVVDE